MYFFSLRSNLVAEPTFVSNFLSVTECQAIVASVEAKGQLSAGRTEDHQVHEKLRKSDIAWLNPDGENRWLFERIRDCINAINADWFRYDLTGFEGIQFTKYSSETGSGDFYSSHKDTATLPGGTVRKLSFTIQLSQPDSYDGGDVLLYNSLIDSAALSREIGSISFFPSYTVHEVVSVRQGVRYSLVGWACGPPFV